MLATLIFYSNIIINLIYATTTLNLTTSSTVVDPATRKEFPLKEYFGLDNIAYTHLCNGSQSHQSKSKRCCGCNIHECMMYGTCCVDILWNFTEISVESYLKHLVQEKTKYKELSCGQLLPIENFESKYYYIIEKCPPGTNAIIAWKCTFNTNLSIPVFGTDQLLYRNAFCAQCHNITRFKAIDIDVKCMNAQTLKGKTSINSSDVRQMRNCSVIPVENVKAKLKPCEKDTYCKSDNINYKLCHAYYGPLGQDRYRNIHCLKCHKNVTEDITTVLDNQYCSSRMEMDERYTYSFKLQVDDLTNQILIYNYTRKFPIAQFFEIPKFFKLPDKEILSKYLCSSKLEGECCRCDKNCMLRRDCCIDFHWDEKQPQPLNRYLDILQSTSRLFPRCEYVYPNLKKCESSEAIYMIKSCPFGSNIKSMNECYSPNEDILNNIPVIGKDKSVYGNIGCAHCNGVFEYSYVNLSVECNQIGFMQNKKSSKLAEPLMDTSICSYHLGKNNHIFHRCKKSTSRRCHFLNENYELCNSYFGGISSYANYHCAKCDGQLDVLPRLGYMCPSSDPDRGINIFTHSTCSPPPKVTWSLLISFVRKSPPNIKIIKQRVYESPCRTGEIFDVDNFRCVTKCKMDQMLIDGVCKKVTPQRPTDLTIPFNHEICLIGRNSKLYLLFENYKEEDKDFVIDIFHYIIPNSTFAVKFNNSRLNSRVTNMLLFESNEAVSAATLRELEASDILGPDSPIWRQMTNCFVAAEINANMFTTLYNFNPARYFPYNRLCHQPKKLKGTDLTFERNCSVTLNSTTIPYQNISIWINIKENVKEIAVAICKQFHLTGICPRFFLPENVIVDPTSLNITAPGKEWNHYQMTVFTPKQYQPINSSFTVCRSTIKTIHKTLPTNSNIQYMKKVEEKVSLICSSISIVCYIWIISTYLGFKGLRTLPGYSYSSMCVYLILSDSLLIGAANANSGSNVCVVIAVLLHWSLIGSFLWTIVIAYDLVSKFTSFSIQSSNDKIRLLKRRFLITFFAAMIYIAILVIMDQSRLANIGYGSKICWISNFYARLGVYVIPVAIISLSTLIALVFTIKKIREEQIETNNVLQMKRKSNLLKIALKLVIILGTTELIGYIQILNPTIEEEIVNSVFSVIYSITRSLRGVFLLFALIIGGNVMKTYKNRFNRARQKNHRSKRSFNPSGILKDNDVNMETGTVETTNV